MATIIGFFTYATGYATELVHNQGIRDASTVFAFVLWTWVGVRLGISKTKPTLVKHAIRLEYGLAFEGMAYAIDHNALRESAMQIGINIRNYSGSPLEYEIERFDVRVKTRHISSDENNNKGGIIPFGAVRCYWAPAYPRSEIKDFLGQEAEAVVDLLMTYKPLDEERRRKLKMKFGLRLIFNENGMTGASDRILSQNEEGA